MKKFLSSILVLTLIFLFCACDNEENTINNKFSIGDDLILNFKDKSSLVAESEGTLFVINPDKTVSVVGENNGCCDVGSWTNIERIFATSDATYGIQTDGTCLVAQNFTSKTKPKFNNAKKITGDFVLFEDGTIIHQTARETDYLPKCIDIFQKGGNIFIVTENNKVEYHHFEIDSSGYCDINTSGFYTSTKNVNKYVSNWSDVKQINYCWRYEYGQSSYYLTAVKNDGKVYACNLSQYDKTPSTIDRLNHFENIDFCVPIGDHVFIAITNTGKVIAIGNEFSELGGETPKLLTIDNALTVYNFTGTHDGNNFNYAIIICKDGSVFAYKLNGTFPSNISDAFSKWKSFEIL